MIELARLAAAGRDVRFTGIDLFEDRAAADGPGVTLKLAHRRLHSTGARVRLLPGDLFSALARAANTLGFMDLVVISARQDPEVLARAWFYLPRILHAESLVFVERLLPGGEIAMGSIDSAQIAKLASAAVARRRAA